MTTVRTPTPRLVEYICPVCKPHHRRILARAMPGSVVEVYCKQCKFRKIVVIT